MEVKRELKDSILTEDMEIHWANIQNYKVATFSELTLPFPHYIT